MNSVSIGVLPVKYVVNIYPRLVIVGNDHTRPEICFPIWVYHPLPESMLARAKPIGDLGLVYHSLPCLRSGFEPYRGSPLPIITTADRGHTLTQTYRLV